ncbi:hypothetical protein CEXT_542841 [Caerostris extrusa]|uniref:Uncharacterized protein n=1 Tax=Caerostris extrusa TaxID=172846 RepID=A0AAV4Q5B2_CAEEX|nr:hypothetical protein CEXT_542841 [Caerostris extrusa]
MIKYCDADFIRIVPFNLEPTIRVRRSSLRPGFEWMGVSPNVNECLQNMFRDADVDPFDSGLENEGTCKSLALYFSFIMPELDFRNMYYLRKGAFNQCSSRIVAISQ